MTLLLPESEIQRVTSPDNDDWAFGNEVLYRLCRDNPSHLRKDVVIAKIWLIGRSYAAAIERRERNPEFDS